MKESLKYKILIIVRYLGDSLYYPFLSLYLQSVGLLESSIGFILSITPLIGILLNPLYTKLCKNLKITKLILTNITIAEGLFICLIGLSNNYYYILAIVILIAVFGTSHYGMMDSLITVFSAKEKISFGNTRVCGSIAYVVGTTVGGLLTSYVSYITCFIIGGILFGVTAILYIIIKPLDEENKDETMHFSRVLKNKDFLLFALYYSCFFGFLTSCDYFLSLFFKSNGLGSVEYGYIYSYHVALEAVGFFVLGKLIKKRNFNIYSIHILCSILTISRYFIYFLDLPIIVKVIVTGIKGICYALLLQFNYPHVVKMLGDNDAVTGTMILSLISSILIFVMNNVNGNLIESVGYKYYYLITMSIFVIFLLLALYNRFIKSKKVSKLS